MDDRMIHRAVRLRGVYEGALPADDPKNKKQTVRLKAGETITDPDELFKAAEAKRVDLQRLYDKGVISGNWKGVKVKKH